MNKRMIYLQKAEIWETDRDRRVSWWVGGRVSDTTQWNRPEKARTAFEITSLGGTSHSPSLLYFIIRYFNPQLSTG